ncbi:GNAT family N-acetyltransferase [Flavivirga abyssicola]|uniref:GNAT family N-acetyltransferase n=1 Tax=Flavivirga abyssicola TaxID=3063533 RepID=UPI0026E0289A|nr:GNAT family N-acetyltransferase [Flavivirga sp. MEBiC07777]WVK12039.1 GNAT family N-acetyltransferase [Flavivirga sp. MEBiC07777]
MNPFLVKKYQSENKSDWNNFVSKSKNATFLFYRNFMEYHEDRFEDYSLLIYKKQKLIAVFPANRVGDIIFSHQGLTYGGLLLQSELKFNDVLESFKSLLIFLCFEGVQHLKVKMIPYFYNSFPSDEISYLLYLLGAQLDRRDALSVIDLNSDVNISKNRLEGVKKGEKHKLEIKEVTDLDEFWNMILIPNLRLKHGLSPVHSLQEIKVLKERFPNNIRQFNVYHKNKIVAGTTIFETKNVAHSQYISGNKESSSVGGLDFLYTYLIKEVFVNKRYFDFGNSNENKGRNVNEGLQFWKEGFGARTVTQDFYKVDTKNYKLLDSIMI